jgi:hypothetical protein
MSVNLATFRRHDQSDASQVVIIEIDETTLRIYHQHDRLGAPGRL